MATVQGIFDQETFTAVPNPNATLKFDAVHQYHLGLWFNDPNVPFRLGCEPGANAAKVTVFNGEQHVARPGAQHQQLPGQRRAAEPRAPLSTTH